MHLSNRLEPKSFEHKQRHELLITTRDIEGKLRLIAQSIVKCPHLADDIVQAVKNAADGYEKVLVCLDSNHTHAHVLAELEAYAPLVSKDSYCIVFDTLIEDMPADLFGDRPWHPGNSPKTAVSAFLQQHPEFVVDADIDSKLLITVAAGGFLRRV